MNKVDQPDPDNNIEFHYFDDYQDAIWFMIITMTSVGYGDIVAVTPVGRVVTLIATILGALYLAMMVALITEWLILEEKQALGMHKVKDQDKCGRSIVAALKYNAARKKRYRLMQQGNEYDEYIPTTDELKKLKEAMHKTTKKRADCPEKQHQLEVKRQENRLDTI